MPHFICFTLPLVLFVVLSCIEALASCSTCLFVQIVKSKEPIHLLPLRTLWISTCFLCTKSSKQHFSTLLVAHLSVSNPCVSIVQRPSVSTQQSAKYLLVYCLSKCHCCCTCQGHPSLLCSTDHIVQVSLFLLC